MKQLFKKIFDLNPTTDDTWYIFDWNDVVDKEVRKPVPVDLMAEVLKVIGNDRN